ncbi:MAG: 16S rRNA (cytosine(967)-C(5))-methyltransferase RsmB [Succinatimonas sp.]|nr:16S rRNA (cytosine(967)-C(5))-methyltransferase RsmB [Succinatimonas sp.]
MTEKLHLKRPAITAKKEKKGPLNKRSAPFSLKVMRSNKAHSSKVQPKNITAGAPSRAAAAMCISAIEQGRSLTEVLPEYTKDLELRDKAFVQELVYGTLRHRRLLNLTLSKYLNHSLNVRFIAARALLLCGIYQIVFTRTPPHAVVAATVGACSLCNCKALTGLVNAILRNFLRQGSTLESSDDLAVKYSFPDWLYKTLQNDYQDKVQTILDSSNEHAPLWLRVENSKISTTDYLEILDNHEIDAKRSPLIENALRLDEPMGVDKIPRFSQGLVTVQDLSAQLAAPLLELKNNDIVLDACCAPGGKSAHILDICPSVNLTCTDISEDRLKATAQTFKRLGRNPRLLQSDAASGLKEINGNFDKILADVPCSGTGVIRRHPDIKWLRRQKDIESLNHSQDGILDTLFERLKVDGILVYTTCSILKSENEQRIQAFLERHPNASLLPFKMKGQNVSMYQNLPGEDGGDGFFYARITKKAV